jgi:DNA-binding HxlR family transcriptional regulator
MGSSASTEYCAFTKAIEYLGDRWSLLIVRELAQFGPQGFSSLASGLPGRISRSVLSDKLRKLEEMGLVARDPSVPTRLAPYCLTPAGEQLVPTLMSFWEWAKHWVPEDPAVAQSDPTIILWWPRHRIDAEAVPERKWPSSSAWARTAHQSGPGCSCREGRNRSCARRTQS